jgi:hypothetical protein
MATPGFYADREGAAKGVAEHETLKAQVAEMMRRWEELQPLIE